MSWFEQLRGRFLVFDGPDGSGKSTQLTRFVEAAEDAGLSVCTVREPGGTSIGEQIRNVLLDASNTEMVVRCEVMLYMASRAQLVEQVIAPALADNELVVADRFISSTLAYQGTAGGIARDDIMAVGRVAVGTHWPDLTIIFDVDDETRARRLAGIPAGGKRKSRAALDEPTLFSDRMERKAGEFHQRVREGYLELQRDDPDHYAVIDARADEETVFTRLTDAVSSWAAARS